MTKADVKIHNIIFECANCGDLKKTSEVTPIAILKLTHIKPVETKGGKTVDYDMVYTTVFVDPDCFDDLELDEEAPTENPIVTK